ncbi:hypothetical protein HF520_08955 [Romboutsia sp. CE17]|nr:hypothetical protein [Romboutsia sp. CE17]QJA09068.1 hypothetical protein HF520_08955 [Romboutsia sp. CE17]
MSIMESAIKLNEVVQNIAREKGISNEEAWIEAIKVYKEEYENANN